MKYNPKPGNDRGNQIYNLYINTLLTRYEALNLKAQTVLSSAVKRDTPLSIYMEGPPATGKSHVLRRLLDIAYLAKFKTLPGGEDIFYVPRDEAYFDGYQNQEITIFDDADVSSCKKARALMVGIKLNMINTAVCPLPAADPAKKNNLLFTSSFVGTTTNLRAHPTNTAIVDFKALERRYHVQVRIEPDAEDTKKVKYILLNSNGTPYKEVTYEWLQMYVFFLSTNWSILSGDHDFSPSGSPMSYRLSTAQDPFFFVLDYFNVVREEYHADNILFQLPQTSEAESEMVDVPLRDLQSMLAGRYELDVDDLKSEYKKLDTLMSKKLPDYTPPAFMEVSYQGNVFNRGQRTIEEDLEYRLALLEDKLSRTEYIKYKAGQMWVSVLSFGWESYKKFVEFIRKYDTQIWTSLTLLASLALMKWNHSFVVEQMKRAETINHKLNPITLQVTPNDTLLNANPNLQSEEATGHSLTAIRNKGSKGKSIKDIVSLQSIDIPDRKVFIKTPCSIFTGYLLDSTTILMTRHEALAIDTITYLHYKDSKIDIKHSFQLKIVDDLQSALIVLSVKDQLAGVRSCISNLYATEQALTSDLLRYDVYSSKHRQ